ncbi:MAG: DUF4097 family beta strand repeat protein [Candidatus Cloacimonetes bacterium]|nr:DUF4097 family beta strand repeat protein [Candidatus Cloacimonadota bacterium]MCK4358545.1 DUF4097 family beta strand repeat protein [Candidatus Cloacimonadota bacterium]
MTNTKFKTIIIFIGLFIFLNTLSGCIEISIDTDKLVSDDKVKVKGVVLKHKRTIQIEDSKNYGKFKAEVHHGNVEIAGGSSYSLEVEIYEKTEDDLVLTLKDGILTGETKSGKPFAIGNIKGTLPNDINVTIDSGAGNVKFSDFNGQNFNLNVGAGNFNIRNCDLNNIIANTGAGNVSFEKLNCKNIDFNTGVGNIELSEVSSEEIDCNSGVGNIKAYNSVAEDVEFSTGIGIISISECQFKNKDISTGLGRIKNKEVKQEKSNIKEL